MRQRIHMSLDVRGALRWPKSKLRGVLSENGRTLTPAEARDWLRLQLNNGVELIPCVPCDNFDSKRGCQGHPIDDTEAGR